MGIFSNSIFNLLSKSLSKSKFTSNFCTNSSKSDSIKPQKLLVRREHKGSIYYSSIDQRSLNKKDNDYLHNIFPTHSDYFYPVASCNSLLLSQIDDVQHHGALWNPTTDEIKFLPKLSVTRPRARARVLADHYGIGFDRASEDYKVIRFLYFDDRSYDSFIFDLELYSLKADSWKKIKKHSNPGVPCKGLGIHINGLYYWMSCTEPPFIFSFDFANEKFSTAPQIPLPQSDKLVDFVIPNILLAEFDGSLAALVYTEKIMKITKEDHFEFEIWVWNDESQTWVLSKVDHIPDVDEVDKPIGLFNNDQFYFQDSEGQVAVFDCTTRELKNVCDLKADWLMVNILPFAEGDEPMLSN